MATVERREGQLDILIPKIELYPDPELVYAHSLRAIQAAAISAIDNMYVLVGSEPEKADLPKEEKTRREIIMDNAATAAFIAYKEKAPFKFIGIDSEGAKEAQAHKAGVAMDLAIGVHGSGDKQVCEADDVIEGTKKLTHGWEGAWSIVAIAPVDGLMRIPEENGKKINYLQKLFAPKAFKNQISIEKSTISNLQSVARFAEIEPKDITVAIMDPETRPANVSFVENARIFGANIELISSGDFEWCLRAINSEKKKPIIVMGRGGAEEGSIAAVAARAKGATCQLRYVSHADKDIDLERYNNGIIWNVEEFVPSPPEYCVVFAASITGNPAFELKAIRRKPMSYTIDTLVIDKNGFNKQTDEVAA